MENLKNMGVEELNLSLQLKTKGGLILIGLGRYMLWEDMINNIKAFKDGFNGRPFTPRS